MPDRPRVFISSEGKVWQAREVDCRQLAGARRAWCLIFEADMVARRIYQYPANWRELPDPELEQLSWGM